MNTTSPDIAALPDVEPTPKKVMHVNIATRLDRQTAAAFDAELRRRGLVRNQVVKGWVQAWLAKVSAQQTEREAA